MHNENLKRIDLSRDHPRRIDYSDFHCIQCVSRSKSRDDIRLIYSGGRNFYGCTQIFQRF